MAESLRRELMPWGIGVSVLAPATVSTPIWDKAADQVEDVAARAPTARRGAVRPGDRGDANDRRKEANGRGGIPASKVAEAAHHALFSRRPKAEYLVGREAKMMAAAST